MPKDIQSILFNIIIRVRKKNNDFAVWFKFLFHFVNIFSKKIWDVGQRFVFFFICLRSKYFVIIYYHTIPMIFCIRLQLISIIPPIDVQLILERKPHRFYVKWNWIILHLIARNHLADWRIECIASAASSSSLVAIQCLVLFLAIRALILGHPHRLGFRVAHVSAI